MRAELDFTMAEYGAHAPYLRLWPETDEDEQWLQDREETQEGQSGTYRLPLRAGHLEPRYLARERQSKHLGQAFFEIWTREDANAGLVVLSITHWLPRSVSPVHVRYSTPYPYRPRDQALLDALLATCPSVDNGSVPS